MKQFTLICCLFISLSIMGQDINTEYNTEHYRNRLTEFEAKPLTRGQIVFLGNSLTEAGKWSQYFPKSDVANRGISGDNTEGMLNRIAEIAESKPSKLFITAGINDISQNAGNEQIISRIRNLVYQVKIKSPNTRIYIGSVLPINNNFDRYKRLAKKEKQIEKLNKDLQKFCKSRGDIVFINVYPDFLIKKRLMNPQYTTDGLHLTPEGYSIWVNKLREYVED